MFNELREDWDSYSYACGYDFLKPSVAKFIGHSIVNSVLWALRKIRRTYYGIAY